MLRIAAFLRFPLPLLGALCLALPRRLRDWAYDWVAANRYSIFGTSNTCRLSDPRQAQRFLSE